MAAAFCVEALAEALDRYGSPDIFNSERRAPLVRATARTQGSRFTGVDFTGVLDRAEVTISMDGRERRRKPAPPGGP